MQFKSLFLLQLWNHFYYTFSTFFITWVLRKPLVKEKSIIPIINKNEEYYKKHMDRFLNAIGEDQSQKNAKNQNIGSLFYNKKIYETEMKIENNDHEKQWKRRILFENTPRGNIIMYFDVYKLGFVYYSDQHIPYSILNAVAAKYVTIYKCLDFFIDELVRPDEFKSPLLFLYEDKREPESVKTDKKENVPLKSNSFIKYKSYNTVSSKITKDVVSDKKTKPQQTQQTIIKIMNKFINLGKIYNFSFIQTIPMNKKSIKAVTFSSSSSSAFTNIPTEIFSYQEFKRRKAEASSE